MKLGSSVGLATAALAAALVVWSLNQGRAADPPAIDPTGTWIVTAVNSQTGSKAGSEETLKVKVEGGKLTGTLTRRTKGDSDAGDEDSPIKEIRLQGNEISFTVSRPPQPGNGPAVTASYQGTITGDVIKGKVETEGARATPARDWEAKRVKRDLLPGFLKAPFANGPKIVPAEVLVSLLVALVLGAMVAWVYRHTRKGTEISASFPVTLVLLSILIAMVTQVIGDNVARAFSLVGALSIVRFRTIVRDTQDTAYVIFAVVVGMAVGARDLWVALIGISVVGLAAYIMMARAKVFSATQPAHLLSLRVAMGHDLETLLGPTLALHLQEREMMSVSTVKQGESLEVTYETRLRPAGSADALVKALNLVEGVQRVEMKRRGFTED